MTSRWRPASSPKAPAVAIAVALAVLLAVFTVPPAGAQEIGGVQVVGTDLSDYPTVRIGVAVSGEVADSELSSGDLTVTEDGEQIPIEIEPLGAESLEVVLAVDVSGSMAGEPLLEAKNAAIQFLDQLPDSARVALIAFGDSADLVLEATVDRPATRTAISNLDEGGGTALYDAVTLAGETIERSDAERSAIVVLTDGADTTSQSSFELAESVIGRADADFFAVSLETGGADETALQALADAAQGRVVSAVDPEALSAAYVDLGQRIVNQYFVVFESASEATAATFEVTVNATGDSDSIRVALPNTAPTEPGEEAAPAPQTVEQLVSQGRTGVLQQDWLVYAGAALVAVSLLALFAFSVNLSGATRGRRSLVTDAQVSGADAPAERIVASVRHSSAHIADRLVERSNATVGIDAALDRAGVVMRSGEFVALSFGAAIGLSVVLGLLMGLPGLVLGVALAMVAAPLLLSFLVSRRNRQFADQLGDTLLLLSGALRAGFGVGQALDSIAQEMDAPMSVEIQRALLEIRLGRDIETALGNVARRMNNEDFGWVVDAMRINKEVGGDLAHILDQVQDTIRGRARLRRQVRALTAEGRLSAIVLAALPVGITLVLYTTNADYLRPLVTETAGRLMVAASVAMLVAGGLWLRRLIDMEI